MEIVFDVCKVEGHLAEYNFAGLIQNFSILLVFSCKKILILKYDMKHSPIYYCLFVYFQFVLSGLVRISSY